MIVGMVSMKRFKTVIVILAVLSMLLVTGCQNPVVSKSSSSLNSDESISEALSLEQVKQMLNELIPKALEIYSVYFNSMVEIEPMSNSEYPKDGCFKVADKRFSDVMELKEYTEAVFTKEFAQMRFYQYGIDGTEGDQPIFFMKDNQLWVRDGAMGISAGWLIDTAIIKEQTATSIVLSVEKTYFDESDGFHDIIIKKENGQWKVASELL